MAENPAYWTPAERAISKAIHEHDEGMRQGLVGRSVVKAIGDELREAGLLKEEEA